MPARGPHRCSRSTQAGVFEGVIEGAELPLRYELEVDYGAGGTFTQPDPYAFTPTLGELDLHLIGEGRHEQLYELLGGHIREHQGVTGTAFAVWAPAARAVSLIGDFNYWNGVTYPMRSLGSIGNLGAVPARDRRGLALQVRDHRPGRRGPGQGRPLRAGGRAAPGDRLDRRSLAPPLG